MMIANTAKELAVQAIQLRDRQKLGREVAVWRNHAETVERLAARLGEVAGFLDWLAGVDASASHRPRVSSAAATASVRRLRDALRDNPESVLTGELMPNARASVEKLTDLLEESAHTAWAAYIATVDWISADLWAAFRSSGPVGDLVAEAERMDEQYSRLKARRMLTSAADRDAFAALLPAHKDLVARLPDISDREVRDFVLAASGTGASLDSLTPTVTKWLEANGLAGLYVVRRSALGGRN